MSERDKAKKILFDKMKYQGTHELLFPNGKLSDNNALTDTIIDAMMDFKNEKK